jgi:hypothetical protein
MSGRQPIGDDHEVVHFGVEVARVACGELKVVLLRQRSLKRVGKLPAVPAAKPGGSIRGVPVERKAWKLIQERQGAVPRIAFSKAN